MTAVHATYEAPALHKIGNFSKLTMCLWFGSCRDFLGCGRAPICI